MKKYIITILFLQLFCGAQAQSKEETISYIQNLLSAPKPSKVPIKNKDGTSWYMTIVAQRFSYNSIEIDYEIITFEGEKYAQYEVYKMMDWKLLSEGFGEGKEDELYSKVSLFFSSKFPVEVRGKYYENRASENITIIVLTDKVKNLKKAVLHLKKLALAEKDPFGDN
jgi:hypothetical protein